MSDADPSGGNAVMSWARIWSVSAMASLLGSVLGTLVLIAVAAETALEIVSGLPFSPIILIVSLLFSIPAGLILGLPILRLFGRAIVRWPIGATVALGLVGAGSGWAIGLVDGFGRSIDNAPLYFGGIIGGLHALLFARTSGTSRTQLVIAALASVVVVPAICLTAEDAHNLYASKQQFERACQEGSGYLGRVNDDVDVAKARQMYDERGRWYNQKIHRSLYAQRSAIPLGERSVLFASDYAYVPQGIIATLTGGRRIVRHCLSEISGPQSDLMRAHGLGQRPELSDLAD